MPGIPLCFLATLLVRFTGLLAGQKRTPPQNVLFIELSEMGSAILADPAMRKGRRVANARLHFLIFRANAASLRLLGTVPESNVFTVREDNFFNLALGSLRFLFWARRRRIDTVINLELFSRYSALLTGLSGAARRTGFHAFNDEGLYRGHMLMHRVAYNPHLHIAAVPDAVRTILVDALRRHAIGAVGLRFAAPDPVSFPSKRYFQRHHFPPARLTSRCRPPPSNNRTVLACGLAERIAISVTPSVIGCCCTRSEASRRLRKTQHPSRHRYACGVLDPASANEGAPWL